MKSHTDLEQSKKLAEILPIESADMYYEYVLPRSNKLKHIPSIGNPVDALEWYNSNKGYTHFGKEPLSLKEYCIPCWSLAVLLGVLPSDIRRHEKTMFLTLEKAGAYNLYYKSKDRLDELWETDFEPIDVCYKMILDLQKLKISSK